jgi:hypothetical protein
MRFGVLHWLQVSDFGLAIANPEGNPPKNSVQVQGTFGYVAPEYLMNGTICHKTFYYCFVEHCLNFCHVKLSDGTVRSEC